MKKTALRIEDLNHNSSRTDEIEVLQTIANTLKRSGTYLEQLFSPGLIHWVENQTADDACCDIEALKTGLEIKNLEADAAIRKMATELDSQYDTIQKLEWEVTVQERVIAAMKEKIFLAEHPEFDIERQITGRE